MLPMGSVGIGIANSASNLGRAAKPESCRFGFGPLLSRHQVVPLSVGYRPEALSAADAGRFDSLYRKVTVRKKYLCSVQGCCCIGPCTQPMAPREKSGRQTEPACVSSRVLDVRVSTCRAELMFRNGGLTPRQERVVLSKARAFVVRGRQLSSRV